MLLPLVSNGSSLLGKLAYELGISVNDRSLAKAFNKEGYHRRIATEKPHLSTQHTASRLWWAYTCVGLPQAQWNRIIWSDEA